MVLRMLCFVQLLLLVRGAPQVQPQQPRQSNGYSNTEFTEILQFRRDAGSGIVTYSDIWHFCPPGQRATGYALKTKPDIIPREKYLKDGDHLTIVTGIALLCGENRRVRATSAVGKEGTWGPDLLCCDPKKSFLTSLGVFSLRFYSDGTTMIDNVDFRCANPDDASEEFLYGYGRSYDTTQTRLGSASMKYVCNTGICGINTLVDRPYSSTMRNPAILSGSPIPKKDPSGLNDVRFVCCPRNMTSTN